MESLVFSANGQWTLLEKSRGARSSWTEQKTNEGLATDFAERMVNQGQRWASANPDEGRKPGTSPPKSAAEIADEARKEEAKARYRKRLGIEQASSK